MAKKQTSDNAVHSQKHEYHLVDPSPWPLAMSFALLLVASGAVMFMHQVKFGTSIMSAGIIGVLLVMYTWWRDVVKEGLVDKAHTKPVSNGLRIGMGLFIASEVMFFVAFFWAFFAGALDPKVPFDGSWPIIEGAVWPPKGIVTFDPWDLPFLNTLILLLSGTTVTWAHYALLHKDQKGLINGLACTVALGFIFSLLQAYEYSHAAFGFKDGKYASVFYMATGFHGAHVIIGTIFLAVCLFRAMKGHFTPEKHLGFEFAAWYWHFVDVVWIFLFVAIYWWGS